MAQPTTYKGTTVALYIEDTANPGSYIKPCGLNNHSVAFSKNQNEVTVPDCDDPDLPAWIERETESLDLSVSGDGILAAEAVDSFWAAFSDTDSINVRVYIGLPTDTVNGRFWAGKMHLTGFEVTGDRGTKASISVSAVSDGVMTFTVTT